MLAAENGITMKEVKIIHNLKEKLTGLITVKAKRLQQPGCF